jgi:hypothetical protein
LIEEEKSKGIIRSSARAGRPHLAPLGRRTTQLTWRLGVNVPKVSALASARAAEATSVFIILALDSWVGFAGAIP